MHQTNPEMRKKALLVLVFVFLLILNSRAQYEVMVSTDYPPYNFVNNKGELEGFNIDILNAIAKIYGIKINIKVADWKTANTLLEAGSIQAIAGVHYDGTPDNRFHYTRSVIRTNHCFLFNRNFRKKISSDIIRTEKQPLIVVWQNDVLMRYILSINPNATFIQVTSYTDLLNALDRADVTCAFSQKITSMYYAAKMNKTNIQTSNEEVLERNMGFKISKEAPTLNKILDNGLEIIMANGEYQKIYDRWIDDYNTHGNYWSFVVKYAIAAGFFVVVIIVILLVFNYFLQTSVKNKTRDLQLQLELNTKITHELEKQKIKAEESDKMKSAFLANMSHEIRTPMNGIMGFTELLKSNDYSPDKQKRFIEIIQQSGERMLTTINNIIEISKIESGLESINISETNIEKIISELLQFFELEARKKGVALTLEKKEVCTDDTFYSDTYKLNSILTNLIKNALKFTQKGHVRIGYTIANDRFSFYVSDTGIGIAKEKQDAIFNHFVQTDSSISSRYEGSGLGLSICREYVKMLQGDIFVESEIDKGSTFFVNVPNNMQNDLINTQPELTWENGKTEIPAGLKVIVAEDDKISFFYLKYILEEISAEILHATTGFEAIKLTKNNPDTDIILMDSKMPELDGMEAVKQIRKFNPGIFIIAQTAFAQEDYKAKSIAAGCNGFIEKPVDKNKLIDLISKGIQNN